MGRFLRSGLLLIVCIAGAPAFAQHEGHEGHAQAVAPTDAQVAAPASPAEHAADAFHDPVAMAAARAQLLEEGGGMRTGALVLDLAEVRFDDDGTSWRLEGTGWIGGDVHRLQLRFDGETDTGNRLEHVRIEGLYWRAISTWWNLLAGARFDPRPEPSRGFLALGVEGLAPYGIEVRATGYLSDEGEMEARLEAHGGLQLTPRLVLQPRITLDLSLDDVPERQMGRGIPNLELGLRLRWEQSRRFVPYLGLEWQGSFGDTARYVSATGEDPRVFRLVAGASAWL
jgi:copper resistance protein B